MTTNKWLKPIISFEPTGVQDDIINFKGKNLLISSSAGTGKTTVLIMRILKRLLVDDVKIDNILILTFTKAAANKLKVDLKTNLKKVVDHIEKGSESEFEIYKDPEVKERALRAIGSLDNAYIGTIDSFLYRIVKDNFYLVDKLPADFELVDGSPMKMVEEAAMEETLNNFYKEAEKELLAEGFLDENGRLKVDFKTEDNKAMIERLEKSPKAKLYMYYAVYDKLVHALNSKSMKKNIEKVSEELDNVADIDSTIEKWKELPKRYDDFWETFKDKIIHKEVVDLTITTRPVANNFETKYTLVTVDAEDLLERYKEQVLPAYMKGTIFEDVGILTLTNICEKINDENQKCLKGFTVLSEEKGKKHYSVSKSIYDKTSKKKEMNQMSMANLLDDIFGDSVIMEEFLNLVLKYRENLANKKLELGKLTFTDLNEFSLAILNAKNDKGEYYIRERYSDHFEEIIVDEYQDTSYRQERILSMISRNNLIMVGDFKQSIYNFRKAKVKIFLDKLEKYSDPAFEEGEVMYLDTNYRSQRCILDATNAVFSKIMTKESGNKDYDENQFLVCGMEKLEQIPAELAYIGDLSEKEEEDIAEEIEEGNEGAKKKEEEKEEAKFTQEGARWVAMKIRKLVDSGVCTYGDIAIISRRFASAEGPFYDTLAELGIPMHLGRGDNFFRKRYIQDLIAFIKVVDNIDASDVLVDGLLSSMGGFTEPELVNITLAANDNYEGNGKMSFNGAFKVFAYSDEVAKSKYYSEELQKKARRFLDQVYKYRRLARHVSVAELIQRIAVNNEFVGYLEQFGVQAKTNVRKLISIAEEFGSINGENLSGFIDFLEYTMEKGKKSDEFGDASTKVAKEDTVDFVSIHRAKGLEYDYVFLVDLEGKSQPQDNNNIVVYDDFAGMVMTDTFAFNEYYNAMREAMKDQIDKETASEKIRMFYVAMTRAKKQLFMVTCKDEKPKEGKEISLYQYLANGIEANLLENEEAESLEAGEEAGEEAAGDEDAGDAKANSGGGVYDFLSQGCKLELDGRTVLEVVPYDMAEVNERFLEEAERVVKIAERKIVEGLDSTYKSRYPKADYPEKITPSQIKASKEFDFEEETSYLVPDELETTANAEEPAEIKAEKALAEEEKGFFDEIEFNWGMINGNTYKPSFAKSKGFESTYAMDHGSAIHLIMEKLDFNRNWTKSGLSKFVNEELVANQLIRKNMVTDGDFDKVMTFLESDLCKEMAAADTRDQLYKEQHFMKIIEKDGEEIYVDGYIDAFYIDEAGKIVIVDYKTDAAEGMAYYKSHYKKQLDLYENALCDIWGKPAKGETKKIIYSMKFGTYDIT